MEKQRQKLRATWANSEKKKAKRHQHLQRNGAEKAA